MSVPSPAPTSRIFFSQRLRLHYVDWGNEQAPPLILIHGGRDHCRSWDWVACALRPHFHIMAADLRGHGDSEWVKDGAYTFPDFAADARALADTLAKRSGSAGAACTRSSTWTSGLRLLSRPASSSVTRCSKGRSGLA